ncbi:hypothetical protein H696_00564 [Fonticula alba]|uniref:Uncharacterized protein n=1 Tax=Fonticula alba TaxID=691883 RepID=A0A058ZF88_FONAL|nr:hypothetical protein H696_00564 [Fonticula alba]KCV73014.1 hypothetical protein H696_00564 [Fonticula alba]|eukprot:XP_009492715.1 hypothetical protein H696_00564 [Fonticula alba]
MLAPLARRSARAASLLPGRGSVISHGARTAAALVSPATSESLPPAGLYGRAPSRGIVLFRARMARARGTQLPLTPSAPTATVPPSSAQGTLSPIQLPEQMPFLTIQRYLDKPLQSNMLLLIGQRGIGKTRLIDRTLARLAHPNIRLPGEEAGAPERPGSASATAGDLGGRVALGLVDPTDQDVHTMPGIRPPAPYSLDEGTLFAANPPVRSVSTITTGLVPMRAIPDAPARVFFDGQAPTGPAGASRRLVVFQGFDGCRTPLDFGVGSPLWEQVSPASPAPFHQRLRGLELSFSQAFTNAPSNVFEALRDRLHRVPSEHPVTHFAAAADDPNCPRLRYSSNAPPDYRSSNRVPSLGIGVAARVSQHLGDLAAGRALADTVLDYSAVDAALLTSVLEKLKTAEPTAWLAAIEAELLPQVRLRGEPATQDAGSLGPRSNDAARLVGLLVDALAGAEHRQACRRATEPLDAAGTRDGALTLPALLELASVASGQGTVINLVLRGFGSSADGSREVVYQSGPPTGPPPPFRPTPAPPGLSASDEYDLRREYALFDSMFARYWGNEFDGFNLSAPMLVDMSDSSFMRVDTEDKILLAFRSHRVRMAEMQPAHWLSAEIALGRELAPLLGLERTAPELRFPLDEWDFQPIEQAQVSMDLVLHRQGKLVSSNPRTLDSDVGRKYLAYLDREIPRSVGDFLPVLANRLARLRASGSLGALAGLLHPLRLLHEPARMIDSRQPPYPSAETPNVLAYMKYLLRPLWSKGDPWAESAWRGYHRDLHQYLGTAPGDLHAYAQTVRQLEAPGEAGLAMAEKLVAAAQADPLLRRTRLLRAAELSLRDRRAGTDLAGLSPTAALWRASRLARSLVPDPRLAQHLPAALTPARRDIHYAALLPIYQKRMRELYDLLVQVSRSSMPEVSMDDEAPKTATGSDAAISTRDIDPYILRRFVDVFHRMHQVNWTVYPLEPYDVEVKGDPIFTILQQHNFLYASEDYFNISAASAIDRGVMTYFYETAIAEMPFFERLYYSVWRHLAPESLGNRAHMASPIRADFSRNHFHFRRGRDYASYPELSK